MRVAKWAHGSSREDVDQSQDPARKVSRSATEEFEMKTERKDPKGAKKGRPKRDLQDKSSDVSVIWPTLSVINAQCIAACALEAAMGTVEARKSRFVPEKRGR